MKEEEANQNYNQYKKYIGKFVKSPIDSNDYFVKSVTAKIVDPDDENGYEVFVEIVNKNDVSEFMSIQRAILFLWTKTI